MIASEAKRVRILFVEDNDDDVQLELAALREGGLEIVHQTVETAEDMVAALKREAWDVIICDYRMPELNGLDALQVAKQVAPATPFILVSGTVGEDVAVEAMRAGAQDYVLKDSLTRLASAVHRELREAETRRSGNISQNGFRLLADTGAALGKSLDPRQIVAEVPDIVVRDFAEWCSIDLTDEDGKLYRASSAVSDAANVARLANLSRLHPLREQANDAAQMAKHEPVVINSLDEHDSRVDAAFMDIAKGMGLSSAVVVPLVADDRRIGGINLARKSSYSPLEVRIVQELAGRIAIALENAWLYEHAKRAIQARDEFLSIASHELRTPLTALQLQIQGLQDLAKKKQADWADERLIGRLGSSARSVERLGQLVEGLLDVSRISTGRLRLHLEELDLAAIARELVERFREEARRCGCQLSVTAPARLAGSWDRLRIEQVLTNLLSNALKYGAGKPVEIELFEREDVVVLRVVDHGIGIPPNDLDRIFGRFERAVSTRHYGGLGLGLFIARRIVEASGGTIAAQTTPSGGATFIVILPRRPVSPDIGLEAGAPGVEIRSGASGPARPRLDITPPGEAFAFVNEVKDYAIYMIDPRGHVLTWNEGAHAIKGYCASEIVGQSFERFFTEEDRARGRPAALLRRAASEGRAEDEAWRVRKDRSRFWADVVITAVHDADGRLRGFVKVTRDLTERRRAEEEAQFALEQAHKERARAQDAERALRLRDDLISVAERELRGPLTALQLKLQGLSQSLEKPDAAPPDANRLSVVVGRLDAALRQIDRLTQTVERLAETRR